MHPADRPCPRCRHPNRALAKFCDECGLGLPLNAAAVAPGLRAFPLDNTAPDAAPAERRQAAVLFVDISGYTEQCARSDAEQVQAMLSRFYAMVDGVVEGFGGRVFDRAGDGVMAVFGAPVAHGNDAERSVRAALGMHAGALRVVDCDGQPLRLHIGIASGEVVAAAIAAGGKSKYSVTGETVNLAARLDALAVAGDTLISEVLYRSVSTVVDATAHGERVLKGIAQPVSVWRVAGLRAGPAERSRFVGRASELAQLVVALERGRDSGHGVGIVLRGQAGIGKSRLVDELRERAIALGFDALTGQALDFGVGKGQDAIASMLNAALRIAAAASVDERLAAVRRACAHGLVADAEEVFVNDLLDLPQPSALKVTFDAMDHAGRLRRTGDALCAVLGRASRMQPVLVILEDLHWASEDVLRHTSAVASATAQCPLVVLLTTRPDGDPLGPAWRGAATGSTWFEIDLAPLSPEDASQLAAGMADRATRLVADCIARAEGNPLFLEQLLRARSEAASVPPTIQSLVLERLDRLADEHRRMIQAASVIGKRFTFDSVQAIEAQAPPNCDVLLEADLVRCDGAAFRFSHALIQEAVYASTLKSRRRELHRRAAAWFGEAEPVLQAEHLDRAEDARAPAAYLSAAQLELERYRYAAALRLADRGAVLCAAGAAGNSDKGTDSDACALALLRGDALREMGRSADSIAAFSAAVGLARHDLQRCHAWLGMAAGRRITGEFDQAMDALRQAQPIAQALDLPVECSKIHHMRGNLLFAQGKASECEGQHQLALQHALRSGSAECEALALSGLGDAQYAQGRMRAALAYFERCVALCAGRGWVRVEGPNRCMTGHCLWYLNRLGEAIDEARRACADAEKHGVVPVQVFAQTSLAQFLCELGRDGEAEQACDAGLVLARAAGSRRYESLLLLCLADVRLRRAQPEAAHRHLEAAIELARETGLGFIGAPLFGRLARAEPGAAEREHALREGEALLCSPGLAHGHLWFYRDAMEAGIAAHEWPLAARYADALEAFVAAEPLPWASLIVERCRALMACALDGDCSTARQRLAALRPAVVAAEIGWALRRIDTALG